MSDITPEPHAAPVIRPAPRVKPPRSEGARQRRVPTAALVALAAAAVVAGAAFVWLAYEEASAPVQAISNRQSESIEAQRPATIDAVPAAAMPSSERPLDVSPATPALPGAEPLDAASDTYGPRRVNTFAIRADGSIEPTMASGPRSGHGTMEQEVERAANREPLIAKRVRTSAIDGVGLRWAVEPEPLGRPQVPVDAAGAITPPPAPAQAADPLVGSAPLVARLPRPRPIF